MTSIFIFISGATLLVYSAERLIGSLVGMSRGLGISVFLLAIIFTGIEFDDIVLGDRAEPRGRAGRRARPRDRHRGVVQRHRARARRDPHADPVQHPARVHRHLRPRAALMFVFAVRKEVTTVDAIVLILLFVAWIAYVAVREAKRETATFRNLEIIEEAEELRTRRRRTSDPVRTQAVDTMSVFKRPGRWSGWINLGLAMVAICGIIIGAATVSTGTDQILNRYGIEGTVFGATIVTAVLSIEDLFLTVRPIRKGVPEIGIGNVIGSLIFSVTGKLGIVVLAGGSVAIGSSVLHWHLPVLARPDRARRILPVDRGTQALARLRAARALPRLLGRQLRRLRRRPDRRLTRRVRPRDRDARAAAYGRPGGGSGRRALTRVPRRAGCRPRAGRRARRSGRRARAGRSRRRVGAAASRRRRSRRGARPPSRATRIRTAPAPAYLRAFVSDSLTTKYAASSTSSGSSSVVDVERDRGIAQPTVSDSSALRSPRSESATGCSPRARSRSSACASPSSSLGQAQDVGAPLVARRACAGRP